MVGTKSSAGALRAARRVFDPFRGEFPRDWITREVKRAAKIIDRETGVAELLRAAKKTIPYIPFDGSGPHWSVGQKLEQAIAKYERGEN